MSNKFLMRGVDPGVLRRRTAVAQVQAASARCGPGTTIPADWDWTSAKAGGNVFPVRPSQGACGSCWAQAAIAALESRAMIDGVNAGPNLSEDQLLGCVNAANGYRSRGCGGGLAEEALDYISRQFAADEQTYAGTPGSGCKTNATRRSNAVSLVSSPGWRPVASLAEAIRRAVYCEGPVIVYLQE
ncbi:hypothetical protein ABPG75_006353 [Micractinium tetrahymenae]